MSGKLIAFLVDDNRGRFVRVTRADDVIWVSDELWDAALQSDREHLPGRAEIEGHVLSIGSIGEELGRVAYLWTGAQEAGHRVCKLVREERGDE